MAVDALKVLDVWVLTPPTVSYTVVVIALPRYVDPLGSLKVTEAAGDCSGQAATYWKFRRTQALSRLVWGNRGAGPTLKPQATVGGHGFFSGPRSDGLTADI